MGNLQPLERPPRKPPPRGVILQSSDRPPPEPPPFMKSSAKRRIRGPYLNFFEGEKGDMGVGKEKVKGGLWYIIIYSLIVFNVNTAWYL